MRKIKKFLGVFLITALVITSFATVSFANDAINPVQTGTPTVAGGTYYTVTPEADGSYTFTVKTAMTSATMGKSGTWITITTANKYKTYDSSSTSNAKYLWISYDVSALANKGKQILGFGIKDNSANPSKNFTINGGTRIDYLVDLSKSTANVEAYVNGVLNTGYTYDFTIPETEGNLVFYSRSGYDAAVGDDILVYDNLEEKAYDGNTDVTALKAMVASRATSGTASFYASPLSYASGNPQVFDDTASASAINGLVKRNSTTIKANGINEADAKVYYASFALPQAKSTNLKFIHFTTYVKANSFDGVGSFIAQTGYNQIGSSMGLLGSGGKKRIDVIHDVSRERWHLYFNGVYLNLYINSALKPIAIRGLSAAANTTNEFTFEDSKYTYYYTAGNENVTLETLEAGLKDNLYSYNYASVKYNEATKTYTILPDVTCYTETNTGVLTENNDKTIYIAGYDSSKTLLFVSAIDDQALSTIPNVDKADELKLFAWASDMTPLIVSEPLNAEIVPVQ